MAGGAKWTRVLPRLACPAQKVFERVAWRGCHAQKCLERVEACAKPAREGCRRTLSTAFCAWRNPLDRILRMAPSGSRPLDRILRMAEPSRRHFAHGLADDQPSRLGFAHGPVRQSPSRGSFALGCDRRPLRHPPKVSKSPVLRWTHQPWMHPSRRSLGVHAEDILEVALLLAIHQKLRRPRFEEP